MNLINTTSSNIKIKFICFPFVYNEYTPIIYYETYIKGTKVPEIHYIHILKSTCTYVILTITYYNILLFIM